MPGALVFVWSCQSVNRLSTQKPPDGTTTTRTSFTITTTAFRFMGIEIDLFDSKPESNAAGRIAQAFWPFDGDGSWRSTVLRNRKGASHKRAVAAARLVRRK